MLTAGLSMALREGSSHRQTRILLFGGFGGLLLLMGVLGLSAISFLYQIEIREERIRSDYVARDRALGNLRSNIYIAGTNLRDFLLDESQSEAQSHREQFLQKRSEIESEIAEYQALTEAHWRGDLQHLREPIRQLKEDLASFFAAARPVLDWGSSDRQSLGYRFMQDQVLPRRYTALGLADRIQQVSDEQLNASSDAVTVMLSSFRTRLLFLLIFTILAGLGLAGVALWRLLRLERESEERFRDVLTAREELTRLSGELVSAQENERRRISRELHDEVGQALSAIVLGVQNLRSALVDDNKQEAFRLLQLMHEMAETNVNVVRNIALLLRPSMLDDLGLVPAVRWLAREFSRNGAMSVDVLVESFPDALPDEHRTCIFRVVQEAVRNAARHSGATQVRIYLREEPTRLRVSVQDDGKGFTPAQEPGLGIIGMQERANRLGGELRVESEPGRGTIVSFTLPLPDRIENLPEPRSISSPEIDSLHTAG